MEYCSNLCVGDIDGIKFWIDPIVFIYIDCWHTGDRISNDIQKYKIILMKTLDDLSIMFTY